MPGKEVPRLSKRTVDAFAVVDKDAIFWDRDLPSFGVRVYTTGRKVYVVQTRGPGGPKRVSIGRHGEVAAEQARKQAAVIIDRIKQGLEPVPAPELTVAGLAERYLQGHVAVNCRASTLKSVPGHPRPPASCRNSANFPSARWTARRSRRCTTSFAPRRPGPTRRWACSRDCSNLPRRGGWRRPAATRAGRCACTRRARSTNAI